MSDPHVVRIYLVDEPLVETGIIGPFEDEAAATAWAQKMREPNNHDTRYQIIPLTAPY